MDNQQLSLLPARSTITHTLRNGHFLGGMAVGAAVVAVLSNEAVQRSLFRGLARVAAAARAGAEEVKERFHDAEAEVRMEGAEEEEEDGEAY